jgi:hypothetical protein
VKITSDALYSALVDDLRCYAGSASSLLGKGVYPTDLSRSQRAALSLSNSFLKKFMDRLDAGADRRARDKFLAANAKCAAWKPAAETPLDEHLLNGFKDRLWRFFQKGGYQREFGPDALCTRGRVGPGSSLLARGTDFYTKMFDSPLSCTSLTLYHWYNYACRLNPTWERAEEARKLKYGTAQVVQSSRLSFVPKTTEISRVICVEPTLNMWFQLAAYDELHDGLRRDFGIDLSIQPERNRALARLGSVGGGYTTIDLESASDSVSISMLEWALPKEVFRDLSKYRCSSVEMPDRTVERLQMFSSMGNGYTFPLQTIIFAAVVCSVYHWLNIPIDKPKGDWHGNYGVFGDDIICLDSSSRLVIRLLGLLGFRVNESKSFSEGPFRESCGADFYHGQNVRGVYLKEISKPSIYAMINNLVEFTARTGVAVPKVLRLLRKMVPWTPVPRWENDDAGIKTPLGFFRPRLDRNGSYAYYAWRPRPFELEIEGDKVRVPRGFKQRCFNPDGLYIALLHGSLKSNAISVRHDRVWYVRRLAVAPNWFYASHRAPKTTETGEVSDDWKRWESAFYVNL